MTQVVNDPCNNPHSPDVVRDVADTATAARLRVRSPLGLQHPPSRRIPGTTYKKKEIGKEGNKEREKKKKN